MQGDVTTLSNNYGALSNTLAYEMSNILDLIDEATAAPYVLPNDTSLGNLIVERVKGIGFPKDVYVQGSLYPDGNLHQIGNPAQR